MDVGYIRLVTLMTAHMFSLCYEVLSGYLRGFGISLPPRAAVLCRGWSAGSGERIMTRKCLGGRL